MKELVTAREFDHYPFDETKRYELDEGVLIVTDKPPYLHNRVSGTILGSLSTFLISGGASLPRRGRHSRRSRRGAD